MRILFLSRRFSISFPEAAILLVRDPWGRGWAFPACSPRIRHRNELTEMDWENAVQGLGKI